MQIANTRAVYYQESGGYLENQLCLVNTHTGTFLDLGVSQRQRKAETEAGKERKWVKALPHLREMAAEGKGRKK